MSTGGSTGVVYRVEARLSSNQPEEVNGILLGKEWREVSFERSPIGVPVPTYDGASAHGYLNYEAAEALRWWFHANARMSFCLETRLVAYDWKISWSAVRKSTSEPMPMPRRPWDDFTPVEGSATPPVDMGEK